MGKSVNNEILNGTSKITEGKFFTAETRRHGNGETTDEHRWTRIKRVKRQSNDETTDEHRYRIK